VTSSSAVHDVVKWTAVIAVAVAALASVTSESTRAGAVPVFGGCTSKVRVRPASIVFACGDGNFFATRLHWSRWDAQEAVATGTGHQNDCVPDCAHGRFHTYAVSVGLSAAMICAHLNEFSKLSWRFVRRKPARVARQGSESFSCHWRKVRP
jgi:hypothetical protein